MDYQKKLQEFDNIATPAGGSDSAADGAAGVRALHDISAESELIKAELERINAAAERNINAGVWKFCLSALDLTSLDVADSERSVSEFAGRAARFSVDFPHLPPPASVCVWPSFVDVAGLALGSSRIAVTSVAGGFPSSQTFLEVKMLEAAMAVESGADEIDVVISIGELLSGEYDRAASEIALLREEVGEDTVLKVILEVGALAAGIPADATRENAAAVSGPRLIRDSALLAMLAGADFVKTSTGKLPATPCAGQDKSNAPLSTPEAAIVMCRAIRDFHARTGRKVGFKAAGGIKTAEDAVLYYTIAEQILGPEWLTARLFRIGASSLANDLLGRIEGGPATYF